MPDEVLRNKVNAAVARSAIEIATSEPAFVEKWPRAWRVLFLLGGAMLLWGAIFWVVRWVA